MNLWLWWSSGFCGAVLSWLCLRWPPKSAPSPLAIIGWFVWAFLGYIMVVFGLIMMLMNILDRSRWGVALMTWITTPIGGKK